MSSPSKSDSQQIQGPFLSLRPGTYIRFSLFPDVPTDTVALREGYIVSVDVQVAPLQNGTTTVQTLLGLMTRPVYQTQPGGPPEELVPLEALETVQVLENPTEAIPEILTALAPSLRPAPRPAPKEPLDVKALLESKTRTPFDPMGKFRVKKPKKAAKRPQAAKAQEGASPDLYIAPRR